MKRLILIILSFLILIACASVGTNMFQHALFTAVLPEHFEVVPNADILCFAPHGDPLLSSSITFYSTELNWYFDCFDANDYRDMLTEQCGYDALTVNQIRDCRVDGYTAKRIACKVKIDQGEHDLIIYAIQAGQTYFFTLLNRDTDSYIDAFDAMIKTLRWKGSL